MVHPGAGGVGLLLTQIIKQLSGNVISTVSAEKKAELSRRAGADEVFLYGEGVDVVHGGIGKDTFDASLASLKPLGSMVLFGEAQGQVPPSDIQRLNSSGGIFVSRPSLEWFVRSSEELAKRSSMLFDGREHGRLNFRVGATFTLADVVVAHRALQARETTGKVVLEACYQRTKTFWGKFRGFSIHENSRNPSL